MEGSVTAMRSGHLGTGLNRSLRSENDDTSLVRCRQKHSLAFHSPQLGSFEIGDDDNLLADEILGGVMISYARANLALLIAEIDLKNHQTIGIRMRFRSFDCRDFEFDFAKIINGDHRASSRVPKRER